MLSNRSIWRKWLLLFTCWSLISTMAFMSVGISDADAANVHPASVHPASVHTATRAAAGQNRSAAEEVGPSKHSRGDGLWTLSSAGEVTHVTYKNGKYVADASRDIPFWTRSCTPNYGISGGFSGEGFGNQNRGVFDGLAVSSADKGASTMYAVHSYSNTTTPYKVEEANSGIALYRYRKGRGWNTWKITGYEGHWKITEQEVHWNGNCSQGSSSKSASYNPSTSTPNSSGNSPRNYTFDSARTNFSGGAIINAGTPQEAYIFGGTDSTQFQGSNLGGRHGMKIFSFQPGNGGGVVKYLGYIPIESYSTPQSVYSGFTTDAEGNIYAAVGQKWGGNNLNLKVYKLTNVPAEMNNIYGAVTGRQFTFGEDGHWGGSYNFNNKSCGALGGTPNWQVNNTNCTDPFQKQYSEEVVSTNLEFDEYVDGFTGITIAPDKHVTVGVTLGNSHHGKVVEIDANEVLVDKQKVKYFDAASLSFGQVHQNNDGILNILHTDIEGVLAGPQTPQPPQPGKRRWLTLYKTVENRKDNDQFQVDLNPLYAHNNQTQYAINHGGAMTSFAGQAGTQKIGERIELPGGLFEGRIGERAFPNGNPRANRFDLRQRYVTKLECSNSGHVTVGEMKYDVTNHNRYLDIAVDPDASGEISCTLTNTGPKPDTPAQAEVTVYKNFASFYNKSDTFNVGLNYAGVDYASPTGVQYGPKLNYEMGSAQVPLGSTITVFEKNYDGSVTDYNVGIACYRGGLYDHESQPFTTGQPSIQDQGIRKLDVSINSLKQGSNKISCFVSNEAKPKPVGTKTIKIYKNFDVRAKATDNFKIGFSYPGLQQPYSGVTANGYPDNVDLGLVSREIPKTQSTINVFEEAKANSGTDLTQYKAKLTCFDGQDAQGNGRNGSKIYESPENTENAKTWDNVDISAATSGTVNCFIDNRRKAGRKLHFYKVFQGTANTNGFLIRAGINGFVPTAGGTVGQPIEIARDVVIPDGNYPLSLYEETENSANINLKNFNISLTCVDGVGVSKTFSGNKTNYQWFTTYGDMLPENMTGDITCTLTNRLDAPKTQLSAYKQLKRYENGDQFEVSFVAPGKSPQGTDLQVGSINTSTSKLADTTADGYSVYEIGKHEYQRTADAFNFKFQESARSGAKLSNYSSSVTCKAVNDAGVERDLTVSNLQQTQSTDGTSRTVTGNFTGAESAATVRCYLHNQPKPKVKVVLYKDLKSFYPSDEFSVGMLATQSASATQGTPVIPMVKAENANLTEPSRFAKLGSDYTRYQIGTYEYTRDGNQDFNFRIEERAVSKIAKLVNYKSNLVCNYVASNGTEVENVFTSDDQNAAPDNGTRSINGVIPAGTTNATVHCYLRNIPKTKVVLYKQLARVNTTDQFEVGLYDPQSNPESAIGGAINTGTAGFETLQNIGNPPKDYDQYKVGEHEFVQSANGVTFRVKEWAQGDADIANYNKSLFCQSYDYAQHQWNDFTARLGNTQSLQNGVSADVTIPADKTGEVHCYLRNSPGSQNTKLVLYKQLPKDDASKFWIDVSNPSSVLTKYITVKKNNDLVGQVTVQAGSPAKAVQYDQYLIGEHKYTTTDQAFRFRVTESGADNADITKYEPKLVCNAVDGNHETPIDVNSSKTMVSGKAKYIDAAIPANRSGEVHCYLRNEPKPETGSITIHKISSVSKLDLAGSEWMVQHRANGSSGEYQDYGKVVDNDTNTPNQLHDADPRPGYIKIDNLPIGTALEPFSYKVVETVAPLGFALPDANNNGYLFHLYVGKETQDRSRDIENDPADVPMLPFTGGWGTLPYMILGFVLTGGAVMAFVIAKPKKRKN